MSWYAVAALDDALDATKSLLTPLDAGQWLALALVVFFFGGTGTVGSSFGTGSPADGLAPSPGPGVSFEVPASVGDARPLLLGAVAAGLVVGLLYVLVGAVMEFVFVESLRRRHVRLRAYADQHLGRALGLFLFRVALGLLVAVPAVVLGASVATGGPEAEFGLLAALVPLLAALALAVAAVDAFTANFVVPVMIQKDVGVLAGWRRFWPSLTRQWRQYGVYALVRAGFALAVGLVVSVVGGAVGALLVAPLVLVAVVAVPVLGGVGALLTNPLALAVAGLLLLAYLVVLTAVLAVALVPVRTYLRYHALLVLGDADREFDLIPGLRREIRGAR